MNVSIANATPLPGFLQPSTHPGVMNVFFSHFSLQKKHNGTVSHISCQFSISYYATPSQQYENPNLIILHLPQTILTSTVIPNAKITQPITVGYELFLEKEWTCYSSFIIDPWTQLNNHDVPQ